MVTSTNPMDFIYSTIAVNPKDYETAKESISKAWKTIIPDTPFESEFLSDSVKKQYENDKKVSDIIFTFTTVAIIISCLGLYGLSIFMAERRAKEIGIRKVLGASVSGIIQLLSKDFLKHVLIAIVIAAPVGWWCMTRWLQSFAYKIALEWWMFAMAGLLSMVIALLTVGYQAIKAALANPVKSLKSE
jgi:putative ABC transport system permease protein